MAVGIADGLGAIPDACPGEEMVEVRADRRWADHEVLGDLGVRETVGDQREHLCLTWGEPVGQPIGRGRGGRGLVLERGKHGLLHGRIERCIAGGRARRAELTATGAGCWNCTV